MDYIVIIFLLAAISIITIFVVFYSFISKQINNYIVPLITLYNTNTRVNQIKMTMETLDK